VITTNPAGTKLSAAKSVEALLAEARSSIAAKKWTEAIATLKTAAASEPSNADVQNLLGYANRNNGDYPAALSYYAAALVINPNHTGALEYQGVAFLKLGQPAKAKANLVRLKKICGVSCEEYQDLARAIKAGSAKKTARIVKP
jgi:tetratricopeptide (TPR) repeat protein